MMNNERQQFLLNKLSTKEIDLAEFCKQCALWGMELPCWTDYEVRQFPFLPKEVQEYNALPIEKRIRIDNSFFYQPPVVEYLKSRSSIFADNLSDYQWLLKAKSHIPDIKEYFEFHIRLDKKLSEFEDWFNNCGFAGYPIKNKTLDNIKDVFSAEEF